MSPPSAIWRDAHSHRILPKCIPNTNEHKALSLRGHRDPASRDVVTLSNLYNPVTWHHRAKGGSNRRSIL